MENVYADLRLERGRSARLEEMETALHVVEKAVTASYSYKDLFRLARRASYHWSWAHLVEAKKIRC